LHWAEETCPWRPYRTHRGRIRSGLTSSPRDEIDAETTARRRRDWPASRYHLPTVARYWYKVAQAAGGALGMGGVFDGYRRARRWLVHRRQVVDLGLGPPDSVLPPEEH
jgi:hypothetical protein